MVCTVSQIDPARACWLGLGIRRSLPFSFAGHFADVAHQHRCLPVQDLPSARQFNVIILSHGCNRSRRTATLSGLSAVATAARRAASLRPPSEQHAGGDPALCVTTETVTPGSLVSCVMAPFSSLRMSPPVYFPFVLLQMVRHLRRLVGDNWIAAAYSRTHIQPQFIASICIA